MDFGLIISSFFAGLVSFLMPCTLPLIPSFLAIITGGLSEIKQDGKKSTKPKMLIISNALLFIMGFALVFVFFGMIVGLVGRTFGQYRILLSRVSGIIIILFGLFLLDIAKFKFLQKNKSLLPLKLLKPGKALSSFLVGMSMGLGWTPCIGPILGSILLLASTSETVFQGGFMLFIFSIGLGLPFLILAIIGTTAIDVLTAKKKLFKYTNIIGGVLLIFIGVLQLTDKMGILGNIIYKIESLFNYSSFLDYL